MKEIKIPTNLYDDFIRFLDMSQSIAGDTSSFSVNELKVLKLIRKLVKKETGGCSGR